MAASTAHRQDASNDHILRPRPQKSTNPAVLRAVSEDHGLKANGHTEPQISTFSSGRSTPIPEDAPPSAHSISSARKQIRAQQKHRMFPTVEFAARVSHFDPRSEYKDFRGFFVLFWIGLAIMVITTVLRNIKDTGYPLRHQIWDLLTTRTWELAISDGAMVATTALSLTFQKIFRNSKGWLRWESCGMCVQSTFQVAWLLVWVNWPFILNWTWTHQVCFTLHTLALLMKMHSYAFYNGHLSTTEHRLSALDNPERVSTAAAVRYPSSSSPLTDLDDAKEDKKKEADDADLAQLREDLAFELTSPLGHVTYPQNLTIANYADYILCPTLCYELEYPRTPQRNYMELFYKSLAVFGCIFLLVIISEEFIVPVLSDSAEQLRGITSWLDMGLILAETISLLLFPFMITFLLCFLVIFEYLLGAFAEITCFADRHFYSDWWNSCDWLEFSREWNIPVHQFLRRHVYAASRPYISKNGATLLTFLISAAGHELVMGCITKKLRGYGFVCQMTQLPIVAIQRTQIVRSKTLFNNVLFWISMIFGLSLMCALYVLLPAPLQSYIDAASEFIHRSLPHQASKPQATALEKTTAAIASLDSTTLASVLLPLLALIFFMSHFYSGGGRYSPFAHTSGVPRVTEDDYHYIPADHDSESSGRYRSDSYGFPSSYSHRSSKAPEPDLAPDILILRHKGTTYPLHFPAFDISEGRLKVGEVRRLAARETKTDDYRRIKLIYKGKSLNTDHRACKDENLKQNSEIMLVISSEPYPNDGNASDSSASSDTIANGLDSSPRVDVDGTIIDRGEPRKRKGHRGGRKKKGRDSAHTSPRDSGFLAPPSSTTANGAPRQPSPSPSRRAPSPAPPPKKPSTPAEALDMISSDFQRDWVPLCVEFMDHPPSDTKAKDFEYKKLSEGILAQVLLKLDGVVTEGDPALRARRKELVTEAQAWLADLDKAQKKSR